MRHVLGYMLLTCFIFSSLSMAQQPQAKIDTQNKFSAAKIEQLLAMDKKERKAHIESLDPKERRGLWAQLKREQSLRNGLATKQGAYQSPTALDPSVVSQMNTARWNERAVGTIAYDRDFPTIGFGGGEWVGNRFNTHTGVNVWANGTVNTVQAVVVPGPAKTNNTAGIMILGPQTGGGGATALATVFSPVSGVIDSIQFTGLSVNYTGSEFFVLLWDAANSYIPVLGNGTTLGQGHHGVVGYAGGAGVNGTFNLGGGMNAFVRATGNIVPVELMNFDVQ